MKKYLSILLIASSTLVLSGCTNEDIGTVTGAVAGGVIGSQFGGGTGKTVATIGGAVAGGYVGKQVGKNWN